MKIGDILPPLPRRVSNPKIRDDEALNGILLKLRHDAPFIIWWCLHTSMVWLQSIIDFPTIFEKRRGRRWALQRIHLPMQYLFDNFGLLLSEEWISKTENLNKPSLLPRVKDLISAELVLLKEIVEKQLCSGYLDGRGGQFADTHKPIAWRLWLGGMPFSQRQWLVSPCKNWFHKVIFVFFGIKRRSISQAAIFEVKFGKKSEKSTRRFARANTCHAFSSTLELLDLSLKAATSASLRKILCLRQDALDPVTPILIVVVRAAHTVSVGDFDPPSWAALSHGAQPFPLIQTISNRGFRAEDGNTKQLHVSNKCTAKRGFCPDWQTVRRRCCVLSVALVLVSRCLPSHHVTLSKSVLTTSGCCCSASSPPPSSSYAHLPVWPSTRPIWPPPCSVQCNWSFGPTWLCSWSVGARFCREAGSGSQRTFLFETWICSLRMFTMPEGWTLWQRACHCAVVHSSQWTPHGCRRTIATALPDPCRWCGAYRGQASQGESLPRAVWAREVVRKLVVLAGEVGGRWSAETMMFLRLLAITRARCENALLRRRAEQAWRMRWGNMLGETCWRVPQHGLSPRHCWNSVPMVEVMVIRHCSLTCCLISARWLG